MRNIPTAIARELDASSSPDALLGFLTVQHPVLLEPLRVVSDVLDYELGGETFIGCPFEYVVLTDNENPGIGKLKIQNIDSRIGEALNSMDDRATIGLQIRSSRDFNLSVVPRIEKPGGSSVLYGFLHFSLIEVTVNAEEASGTLQLRDYSQEPWPGKRATQSRFPGLFR